MDKDTLHRFEQKLDKVLDRQTNMEVTLARQEAVLEEHQRRSLANEQLILEVRKESKDGIAALKDSMKKDIDEKLKPVHELYQTLNGFWIFVKWVCGALAIISGAYYILLKLLTF